MNEKEEVIDSRPKQTWAHSVSRDPSVVIACVSLWLYIVTTTHLRGYLSVFKCSPNWFEPSLFQLISFSALPIGIAILMAMTFLYLNDPTRPPLIWWFVYILWCLFFGGVLIVRALVDVPFRGPRLIDQGLLIVMPLAVRWGLKPLFMKFFPAARLQRQFEERIKANDVTGANAIADKIDTAIEQLEPVARHSSGLTFFAAAYLVAAFSFTLGETWGKLILRASPSTAVLQQGDPSKTREILFSDGTRTLVREKSDKGVEYFYRNPAAEEVLLIRPEER